MNIGFGQQAPPQAQRPTAGATPVASSIVIKTLADVQIQLANALSE